VGRSTASNFWKEEPIKKLKSSSTWEGFFIRTERKRRLKVGGRERRGPLLLYDQQALLQETVGITGRENQAYTEKQKGLGDPDLTIFQIRNTRKKSET